MKKFNHGRLVISALIVMFLVSCSLKKTTIQTSSQPPESAIVMENGSMPPGLHATLAQAKVDPACISCNSQNRYGDGLKPFADESAKKLLIKLSPYLKELELPDREKLLEELEDYTMWSMVRSVLIEGNNNNFGALGLKGKFWQDKNGTKYPLTLFRTGITPKPDRDGSCFRSLLQKGMVLHVINLYDGEMDVADLVAAEKAVAAEFNASYVVTSQLDYGHWRDTLRKYPASDPQYGQAMKNVARLIKEQILRPGGEPPRGNILIHCGGGMHRTGMIFGILQRVINGAPMGEVEKSYRYHTGFRNEKQPGGFEQENLDFIKTFDATLLR